MGLSQSWRGVFGQLTPSNCDKLTQHETESQMFGEFVNVTRSGMTKHNTEWFVPILTQQTEANFTYILFHLHEK